MKKIFIVLILFGTYGQIINVPSRPRVSKQFSLAIPAFLLGQGGSNGNSNNNNIISPPNYNPGSSSISQSNLINGGNLFGLKTETRTIVRTVTTVSTPAYRTCTVSVNALTSCAGRKKREIDELDTKSEMKGEITLVMDSSTFSAPSQVSSMLTDGLNSQYLIINQTPDEETTPNISHDEVIGTTIYPSEDGTTQNYLRLEFEESENLDEGAFDTTPNLLKNEAEKGRINFGGLTTVTSTISVTAVVKSFVTDSLKTLTISYAGCLPPSLPVTGTPC